MQNAAEKLKDFSAARVEMGAEGSWPPIPPR
jgi:hypothetical protein